MVRLGFAFGLLLLSTLEAASQVPSLASPKLDELVQSAIERWNVPGVAVVIVQGDQQRVLCCGTRELGRSLPITAETYFPLASCTKALTTALLAMLVDDGLLNWDDPVRKHWPDFHVSDPRVDSLITLRDLLSHRSGIQGHDLLWYRAPWDQKEVLRRAAFLPVDRTFRGSYEYSTIMVMAAAHAASLRAKITWEELIRTRLVEPLGMAGVSYHSLEPGFATLPRASGHRLNREGKVEIVPWYQNREPNSAGSLSLPVSSLVPWLRFQLNRGVCNQKRLVSEASLLETRTPQTIIPMTPALKRLHPETVQMCYGMGWIIYDYRGHKLVAHGGMIDGFRNHIVLVPEANLAIALLNNLHDTKMNQALANSLVDYFLDLPARDWNSVLLDVVAREKQERQQFLQKRDAARQKARGPSLPLDRYQGTYQQAAYGQATIRCVKDQLQWEWSSFRLPMEHWQDDVFRITEGFLEDEFIEFRVTSTGPDALRFLGMVFEKES